MIAIINATLVMKNHLIPEAILLIEDGKIAGFGEMRKMSVPEGCEVIDAGNQFVGPGLIDIHCHCGGRDYFYENPVGAARHHMMAGTTTIMPALYFSANAETLIEQMESIRSRMAESKIIAGLYMEAPYMNPKFGCDRESNPWRGPIAREDYMPVLEAGKDLVRVYVVAPERENIEMFVRDAKAMNPNVAFSVGHSEAAPEDIEALMPYGLRLGTHHTNATGNREKYPEVRGVCVDETVNYNSDIFAELICDRRGIHVDPYMLRLVRKIKGDERIILISDTYYAEGPIPPGYDGVTDINFDFTGEIAGSKLTLNQACRNMMIHTGASIVDVFRFASTNPARAVGFCDRGEIAVGKRADLVITDYNMEIKTVIVEGEIQE